MNLFSIPFKIKPREIPAYFVMDVSLSAYVGVSVCKFMKIIYNNRKKNLIMPTLNIRVAIKIMAPKIKTEKKEEKLCWLAAA